jgi:cysteinyl-tRNA synthetase
MERTDILRLVGGTPLVEIRRLNPYPGVKIMAKIEFMNPGGSIKDRVAVAMIDAAEKSGELTPGKTIIEATSGNTGIGLAMVAAVKGYKMCLIMPDSASEERKRIMRAYGAEIRLTPGRLGTDGAIELAYRLARTEPDKYVLMDQFNNPASIQAHYEGTGLEIWEQTGGKVTHAVDTLGTSGTAMDVAKRLHEYPGVRVVAVEPNAGHKIQGLKNMHESYPPGIYNKKALDQILRVEDEDAFERCRQLAREEGLFVGMSSGAALAGALKLAQSLEEKGQEGYIVVIFPDGGERYLSTPLFAPKSQEGLQIGRAHV